MRRFIVVSLLLSVLAGWSCDDELESQTTASPAVGSATRTATAAASPTARRCGPPYPAGVPTAATVFCADPSGMTAARVVDIIDGDTLDVEIDGIEERVRVYGIDTPERGKRCFREATDALTGLAGAEVRLAPGDRDRDRSGRLLRYVYTPDGLSVDAVLITAGLATAWRQDGALRFALIELDDAARAADAGCLWGQ